DTCTDGSTPAKTVPLATGLTGLAYSSAFQVQTDRIIVKEDRRGAVEGCARTVRIIRTWFNLQFGGAWDHGSALSCGRSVDASFGVPASQRARDGCVHRGRVFWLRNGLRWQGGGRRHARLGDVRHAG